MSEGAAARPSLEEERRGQNPDGSVRDKSLVEIKREMLLAEAAAEEKSKKKKAKKAKAKAKKKKHKHKHKKKKHKHKKRKRHHGSSIDGSSDSSSSSSSDSDSDSDSSSSDSDDDDGGDKGDGGAAGGGGAAGAQPLRYSEMMKGSARTADGSDERVEVRYSSVSGKVISMDRREEHAHQPQT